MRSFQDLRVPLYLRSRLKLPVRPYPTVGVQKVPGHPRNSQDLPISTEDKIIPVVTFNDKTNGYLTFDLKLVRQGQMIYLIGNLLFRQSQERKILRTIMY